MTGPFINVRYHVAEKAKRELEPVTAHPPIVGRAGLPRGAFARKTQFNTDEAAARFYVAKLLEQDKRPAVRALTVPHNPQLVPDMNLQEVQNLPLTKTHLVRFEQTQSSIPIFGSQVIVELDDKRQLISIDAELAKIKEVSAISSITPEKAMDNIAKLTKAKMGLRNQRVNAPRLIFFYDENDGSWHLTWFFTKIAAAPRDFLTDNCKSRNHGLGKSPRNLSPLLNYFVDAHSGKVLFYYSAAPTVAVVPTVCHGINEDGISCKFWGVQVPGSFEMTDPLRGIKTYDLKGKDIETSSHPKDPIHNKSSDFSDTNRAAISAHINAMRVYAFYKSVLMRDSIDGKGMELISVVNCTYARDELPPEWHNAVWYDNRMWYGQAKDANGMLRSFSRFLDIIAHELTHGVTEHTSNLVYMGQSGALNESFSDIFGIIISNWGPSKANADVSTWKWEIGPGLGPNDLPLRDMSNPRRTGSPDHMKDYVTTSLDNGGVHTNSNIHNKAAYNVLTAVDENGHYVFSPRDVAVLYYLCLTRLNSLATFQKVLQTLVDIGNTYYAGDTVKRNRRIQYIRNAYKKVGVIARVP